VVAIRIIREQAAVLNVVRKRVWPRSDERHVSPQHIDELRQLIDTGPAQPSANARQAMII
jgi:hypothetical protein